MIAKMLKHRMIVAWLLIATLLPFHVVKILHFCVEHNAEATSSGEHHDASSCAICNFMLSPFVGSSSVDIQPFFTFLSVVVLVIEANVVTKTLRSYNLRAPPIAC